MADLHFEWVKVNDIRQLCINRGIDVKSKNRSSLESELRAWKGTIDYSLLSLKALKSELKVRGLSLSHENNKQNIVNLLMTGGSYQEQKLKSHISNSLEQLNIYELWLKQYISHCYQHFPCYNHDNKPKQTGSKKHPNYVKTSVLSNIIDDLNSRDDDLTEMMEEIALKSKLSSFDYGNQWQKDQQYIKKMQQHNSNDSNDNEFHGVVHLGYQKKIIGKNHKSTNGNIVCATLTESETKKCARSFADVDCCAYIVDRLV